MVKSRIIYFKSKMLSDTSNLNEEAKLAEQLKAKTEAKGYLKKNKVKCNWLRYLWSQFKRVFEKRTDSKQRKHILSVL